MLHLHHITKHAPGCLAANFSQWLIFLSGSKDTDAQKIRKFILPKTSLQTFVHILFTCAAISLILEVFMFHEDSSDLAPRRAAGGLCLGPAGHNILSGR